MTICIIPARSGSKRIKNKNIFLFEGKPIIYYAITAAKKSNLFKRIIVSTDSKKIAKIAIKYGAEVPFFRDKKLSDNFTPTYKVIADCIKKIKSERIPYHFCIYPTSIFIDKNDLKKAYNKILKLKYNFICPVQKFISHPLRSFKIKKDSIYYNWPKYQMTGSQDLEDFYHDTGSFYIYKTSALLKLKDHKILPPKSTFYILNKLSVDINTLDDLKLAKKLYKKIKH